jgi:TonB family protein
MPSILVVEQEPHYVERISAALGAEGWRVRVVPTVEQALQAAAGERPDLIVAGTDAPGFDVLTFSFSRRAGGPGVLALETGGVSADGVDGRLAKPFTDQQIVLAARKALLAHQRPAAAPPPDQKLTSHDIFGDVLAEVEGDAPPRPVIAPPRAVPPPAPPSPAAAAPPRPAAHAGEEDVQRRLEKTLSGMFGPEPRPRPAAAPPSAPAASAPAAAAPPARRAESSSDNVDALLSRTLSNLDLGKTKTGPRPIVVPPAAPAAPAAAAAASPAASPAVPEGTGVRKGRAVGDFDFAELEELARPTRPGGTSPGTAPARPAAAPAPPVQPAAASRAPEPLPFTAPKPAPTPVLAPVPASIPTPPPTAVPPSAPLPAPIGASVALDPAVTQRIPVFADEGSDQPGERFGQYTLLERIAVGGMAEVWKARMRGVEGFQKTVAIKRILPHMTDNAEFVGMFIDEAKLAAQLTHPNIVHIYDLGKLGRDYYIAMEYVDGRDLRSLLNAGRRKGMPLPLGLSLLIAARVASALDYAHRKRDFEDQELGLVHRDVSPQNVLLTGDGDVKLCDFGIAKAVSKASQTQMGALKGKLQYMSPEQAWGRPVDSRSDLFSLGSVLFEMVTGERLFTGESEISVLESVRQGHTRRPSQVDPTVPREVDEIVARALGIDPKDRFQSAGEMKQRLEAALSALSPATSPTDLGLYIRRVMEPDTAERAEPLAPLPAPSPGPAEPPAAPPFTAAPPLPYPSDPEMPAEAFQAVTPVGQVEVGEEGGRKSRTLLYAAIAALIVIAILTFFFLNHRKGAAPPPTGAAALAPPAPVPAANPAATQIPSALPAGQNAPAANPVDLKAIMDQQLAAREAELRRKSDQQLKDLEKQVAAAKAAGQPPPTAPSSAATPAPAAAAPEQAPSRPAPVETAPPSVPVPEPVAQKEPEPPPPPKVQEKKPEPEAPRTRAGELVEAGPGVSPPQLVSFPKPEYPPMARTLRVEGTVVVTVLVDENGQVQEVRMAEPIRQKVGLNEAALAAARSVRYKPAKKDGVPVKMWTRLRIPFKL